jgi:hypothetical protein
MPPGFVSECTTTGPEHHISGSDRVIDAVIRAEHGRNGTIIASINVGAKETDSAYVKLTTTFRGPIIV